MRHHRKIVPLFFARAAARLAARKGRGPSDSYTDRSLYDRCISRGVPDILRPIIYGASYDITQAPGYVVIRHEMIHEARVIPLDGRPQLPSTAGTRIAAHGMPTWRAARSSSRPRSVRRSWAFGRSPS